MSKSADAVKIRAADARWPSRLPRLGIIAARTEQFRGPLPSILIALPSVCHSWRSEVRALPYVIVRNRVESYAAWKRAWDAGATMRRDAGIQSEQLFRNPGVPDEVLLLIEFPTLEQAREYAGSDELREALKGSAIQDRVVYWPTGL